MDDRNAMDDRTHASLQGIADAPSFEDGIQD